MNDRNETPFGTTLAMGGNLKVRFKLNQIHKTFIYALLFWYLKNQENHYLKEPKSAWSPTQNAYHPIQMQNGPCGSLNRSYRTLIS